MTKKTDCVHLGTGLCPEGEVWAKSSEPCDLKCKAYLSRRGVNRDGVERGKDA